MKKSLLLLVLLISIVNANAESIDGIEYSFDSESGECSVVRSNYRYLINVIIPDSVYNEGKWYRVTSIGSSAFSGCGGLTSISIPNSVTKIHNRAFEYCSELTSISIPNGVTSIGLSAFSGCSGLTSISIPGSVTNIWDRAFDGCEGLTSIFIPSSVTSIGDAAFSYCDSIKYCIFGCNSNILPEAIPWKYIEKMSLDNVEKMTLTENVSDFSTIKFAESLDTLVSLSKTPPTISGFSNKQKESLIVQIPKGSIKRYLKADGWKDILHYEKVDDTVYDIIDNISDYGFISEDDLIASFEEIIDGVNYTFDPESGQCSVVRASEYKDLKEVIIPDSVCYEGTWYNVKSIGRRAFWDFYGLTSISIPNSVTSIGDEAFRACSGLTSISIPSSVTSIGSEAFQDCSGLTSISIPNSVTSIGFFAFAGCRGLTTISIPNSVTRIDEGTFADCRGLTSISIPNSVTSISSWAFMFCDGLTSISIPNSVISIGDGAFDGCKRLTSILIPNSVKSIGRGAFINCDGLTSISIPNSVTRMGDIKIPNSVTSFGAGAFDYCDFIRYCTFGCNSNIIADNIPLDKVKKITLTEEVSDFSTIKFAESIDTLVSLSTTPPKIMGFSSKHRENLVVQIPKGTLPLYSKADGWKDILHYVEVDKERLLK